MFSILINGIKNIIDANILIKLSAIKANPIFSKKNFFMVIKDVNMTKVEIK